MRRMLRVVVLLFLVGSSVAAVPAPAFAANTGFRAPLNDSADPFLTYYQGNYYAAESRNDALYMRKAPTLGGLLGADPVLVFDPTDPAADRQVWAPSFMIINDRWYLYYTAGNGVDDTHRMYALESTATVSGGAKPDGGYVLKGKVAAPGNDTWAIDGLPFRVNGAWYFVYAGANGSTHNQLFVAPMSNPWTISGARTYLPAAGGCPEVREAPAILQRHGRTFLVYSTCDTGKPDYQLWMQSLDDGQNPLVAANWHQYPSAVFARNDATGVYAPGSNAFFTSPDGTEDWIVYHAKNTTAFTYDGRTTRAQKFGWNADGTPNFGAPLAAGATQTVPSGDPGGGPIAVNDTETGSQKVTYAGTWSSGAACGVQCFYGDDHWSSANGASVTYRVNGSRVALLSVKDTGNGIAGVSIDGGAETTVDLYAPIRAGEQRQWLSPRLTPGDHTVRVRVTGQKNPASSGTVVSADRVEVYP